MLKSNFNLQDMAVQCTAFWKNFTQYEFLVVHLTNLCAQEDIYLYKFRLVKKKVKILEGAKKAVYVSTFGQIYILGQHFKQCGDVIIRRNRRKKY